MMHTFIEILTTIFHICLWLIIIAIAAYLLWGFLTKPKWRKFVRNLCLFIANWIAKKFSLIKEKQGKKGSNIKKGPQTTLKDPPPVSQPKDELRIEHRLHTIEEQLTTITSQLNLLSKIDKQLIGMNRQIELLKEMMKQEQTTTPSVSIKATDTPHPMETRRTYYVSTPSMINPVRFFQEDLSDRPANHLFCIDIIDGENGEIDVVSDPDVAGKLLSTLSFQQNIIEICEKKASPATAIGVLSKGKLIQIGGGWQLTEKIKIKII